jgi:hypothetical protein
VLPFGRERSVKKLRSGGTTFIKSDDFSLEIFRGRSELRRLSFDSGFLCIARFKSLENL